MTPDRDRDAAGRPRSARARDDLGRPLPRRTDVTNDAPALPPAAALDRAQRLLDTGRPFEAHEVLEAVWKAAPAVERELWRGLAQLAVGITHAQRGNRTGAANVLQRAAETLAGCTGRTQHGVDVDGLRAWASSTATDLSAAGRPPRLVA